MFPVQVIFIEITRARGRRFGKATRAYAAVIPMGDDGRVRCNFVMTNPASRTREPLPPLAVSPRGPNLRWKPRSGKPVKNWALISGPKAFRVSRHRGLLSPDRGSPLCSPGPDGSAPAHAWSISESMANRTPAAGLPVSAAHRHSSHLYLSCIFILITCTVIVMEVRGERERRNSRGECRLARPGRAGGNRMRPSARRAGYRGRGPGLHLGPAASPTTRQSRTASAPPRDCAPSSASPAPSPAP